MTHIVKLSVKKSHREKNTENGATFCQNRRHDDIGRNLPDPFFDAYKEEMFACHDIINVVDNELSENVNIIINKDFLRKIVKSHILHIKEMEKFVAN